MSNDFKGYFSLFEQTERRSEKAPNHSGTIELSVSDAMKLCEWLTAQPGETNYAGDTVVKLSIAGWDKTAKNGRQYVQGSITAPFKKEQAQSPAEMPF